MWQSLVTIGQATSEVRRRQKDLNYRCVAMPNLMAARWVSVLPPRECYWLVNASPLNYGHCVRTPVLFVAVCGPKYSKLSLPLAGVHVRSLQCRFPIDDVLLRSGDTGNRDQVAKLSEIAPKFYMFLGRQISGGRGPKFLTEFHKSAGSQSNMWQSLVTIGQAISEIRRRKKEKKKERHKQ